MPDNSKQHQLRKLSVRGLGWCLCIVLWTIGLLTVFAVHAGRAVTPEVLHFPAAKFLHFSVYAFLTVYLKWLPLRRGRWFLLAFLSLHAFGSEYIQQFIPDRTGTLRDALIDHLGIALGMALTWKRWLPRRSGGSPNGRQQRIALERSHLTSGRMNIVRTPAKSADQQNGFFAR